MLRALAMRAQQLGACGRGRQQLLPLAAGQLLQQPARRPQRHSSSSQQQQPLCGLPPPPLAAAGRRGTSSVAAAAARRAGGGDATAAAAVVAERVEEKELHQEAQESYLAYAMSVIVGRALPDVRDGLKPVHRRILYAMHDLGITSGRPYKKCARVVGEVLGKYHPHGDAAVYDALVRLAQGFSMQLPLISGHGNFGSLDDDPPAAMRYTECRLAAASQDMLLEDLEADTVDWAATFDASQEEPLVLPAKVPHLLVNGTQGIAVGIATKVPPHNLREVVAALRALVEQPDISTAQLMAHVPAPDFPTGGELIVCSEMASAYETGRGSVLLRATANVEYSGGGSKKRAKQGKASAKSSSSSSSSNGTAASTESEEGDAAAPVAGGKALLVFTEMPYQVCKSDLVARIAELVDAKQLDGIADVRDESDRTGVRLVVEVKGGFSPELVLNQLYKHTRLQLRFAANMVALVDGAPRTLGLKDMLIAFRDFRVQVVQRRAQHRLAKAQARLHVVEGLLAALAQLDGVVAAIRGAADGPAAKAQLVTRFGLSEAQAEAVLALTLRRLTGLEAGKLTDEAAQLAATIADLQALLADRDRVLQVVLEEAQAVADRHGTPRRSRIIATADAAAASELREEDVVPNTPSLVTVSSRGYIKRMPSSSWEAQRRGGKGKAGAKLRGDEVLEHLLSLTAHNSLLFLAASGRAHVIKAHRVPEASRTAAGSPISQVLGLPAPEAFPTLLVVSSFDAAGASLAMATSRGGIKRTPLSAFAKAPKARGLAAIKLGEGEQVVAGGLVQEGSGVMLVSSGGQLALFPSSAVRESSRASGCIKGMRLGDGESLVCMAVVAPELLQQVAALQAAARQERALQVAARAAAAATPDADAAAADDAEAGGGPLAESRRKRKSSSGSSSSSSSEGPWLLLVTRRGQGKRVPLADVPLRQGRGNAGVVGVSLSAGDAVVGAHLLHSADDDVMLASRQGLMARCSAAEVRVCGRAAKGVRLLSLNDGDEVTTVAVVPAEHRTALA